jgi:hypothetical protein
MIRDLQYVTEKPNSNLYEEEAVRYIMKSLPYSQDIWCAMENTIQQDPFLRYVQGNCDVYNLYPSIVSLRKKLFCV